MSAINPVTSATYVPPVSDPSNAISSPPAKKSDQQDVIELSLAGRIALGVGDGKLTSAQVQELSSQLKSINQALQSGAADAGQMESQLSQQIYSDAHNGASIPPGLKPTHAEQRDFVQAGRIVAQEKAGNLTHTQASQLFAQMKQIYQDAANGASPSVTNKAQNQLSIQIYDEAHNIPNSTPTA